MITGNFFAALTRKSSKRPKSPRGSYRNVLLPKSFQGSVDGYSKPASYPKGPKIEKNQDLAIFKRD